MFQAKYKTQSTYEILSLTPVEGWYAHFIQRDENEVAYDVHSSPIQFLAVAAVKKTRLTMENGRVVDRMDLPEKDNEIVGVQHDEMGFEVVDNMHNFAGLTNNNRTAQDEMQNLFDGDDIRSLIDSGCFSPDPDATCTEIQQQQMSQFDREFPLGTRVILKCDGSTEGTKSAVSSYAFIKKNEVVAMFAGRSIPWPISFASKRLEEQEPSPDGQAV